MNRLDALMSLAMIGSGRRVQITDDNRTHGDRLDPHHSVEQPILNERMAAAEAKRVRKAAKRLRESNK